jgi:hypothetical protein
LLPPVSEAVAETLLVAPPMVAPLAGPVMVTLGAALSMVIVTVAEVVALPALSVAITLKLCEPLVAVVVSQE